MSFLSDMPFIFVILLILVVIGLICMIYRWFDHHKWDSFSKPDINAKITNISSEHIYLGRKNFDKLKTTVLFSDGFIFFTYRTKYENAGIWSYRMYIDEDKIKEKAIIAHEKAVMRAKS